MSEAIITKRCPKCKQAKPVSEFNKNRTTKDGLQYHCIDCRKIIGNCYNQSEKGRTTRRAYQRSDKYKVGHYRRQKNFRKTPKAKTIRKRYETAYPNRVKARNAVMYGIQTRKLPQPDSLNCPCGKQAQEYHHHKGYAREHWLDVIPLCRSCHYRCMPF